MKNKTFSQLAQEADALITLKLNEIEQKRAELAKREEAIEQEKLEIEVKRIELGNFDRQLSQRNEEVVRRESVIGSFDLAVTMQENARRLEKECHEKINKVEQTERAMKIKEDELLKRELELVDRERTYKEDLKKEFMNRFMK